MHHVAIAPRPRAPRRQDSRGLTLVEVAIAVAVLVILCSIALPLVQNGLQSARTARAIGDLTTICRAIKDYKSANFGELPLSLAEIGFGDRLDPWGHPYCYLNYSAGTGDGLEWALQSGMLDPAAVVSGGTGAPATAGASGTSGSGGAGSSGSGAAGAANGAGSVAGGVGGAAGVASAAGGVSLAATAGAITQTLSPAQLTQLVQALGSKSGKVFVAVPVETVRRRDQHLLPLNTDFDLFSLGPDGGTAVSLGNKLSLDDVIRANNGRFIGVASKY